MPKVPGQFENCENCGKRFTVTTYTIQAPNGGLFCSKCGKEYEAKKGSIPKKKNPRGALSSTAARRRQVQSRMLDGIAPVGARSLVDMCVDTLTKCVHLSDDLGDLPDLLIDKIARNLSKRRKLRPETLALFTRYNADTVNIYDCSYLSNNDIKSIFQRCPSLTHLTLKNAIAFNDEVLAYLGSRNFALETLSIHGANLITTDGWASFLAQKGMYLKNLKVYFTDRHFGDSALDLVAKHCTNLEQLKIYHNQKVTQDGISKLASLSKLKQLGIQLYGNEISSNVVTKIIASLGHNLEKLSLKDCPNLDNTVLDTIHKHCKSLHKLRITGSEIMTDVGFERLFHGWNNTPLDFIDFQQCRFSDAQHPNDNKDCVGLCGTGFTAMMQHSRRFLRHVDVSSCRHIDKAALEKTFALGTTYPELRKVELSFIPAVDDFLLGLIFKACPKLHSIAVFGCFKVGMVPVPKGRILLGVPNAKGMLIEG